MVMICRSVCKKDEKCVAEEPCADCVADAKQSLLKKKIISPVEDVNWRALNEMDLLAQKSAIMDLCIIGKLSERSKGNWKVINGNFIVNPGTPVINVYFPDKRDAIEHGSMLNKNNPAEIYVVDLAAESEKI